MQVKYQTIIITKLFCKVCPGAPELLVLIRAMVTCEVCHKRGPEGATGQKATKATEVAIHWGVKEHASCPE